MAKVGDEDGGREAAAEGSVCPKGFYSLEGICGLGETGAAEEIVDDFGYMGGELLGGALRLAQRKEIALTRVLWGERCLLRGVGLFKEGDFVEGLEIMGEAPDDEGGGNGVVGNEVGGIFCKSQCAVEDFVVDALFPALGSHGFEGGFELGEDFGGREKCCFRGRAIEGGDDVEVK